jgi:DNA-binding CsgD family transcriptional regulator
MLGMKPSKKGLRERDLYDILKISRMALECSQVAKLQSEVLHLFQQVFNADKGNFFLTHIDREKKLYFDSVINCGVEQKALDQYYQYYYKLDPFYIHRHTKDSEVVTMEDVISPRDLIKSEYYNDFLKPQSIHHEMGIYLKCVDSNLGIVSIFRSRNKANFSPQEKAKVAFMIPCLTGALEKTIITSHFIKSQQIIDSITSTTLHNGIIVLNENLESIYQNEKANKILSKLSASGEREEKSLGSLPQKLNYFCQKLKKSISPNEHIDPCQTYCNQLISMAEERVLIRLHLIPNNEKAPLFLIYLEPETPTSSLSESLHIFGLTRRELEIVNLLFLGLKNSEISDKLFISEHTVENHLKSIYKKLEVKNRASLIHQLTHLNWPKPANGSSES